MVKHYCRIILIIGQDLSKLECSNPSIISKRAGRVYLLHSLDSFGLDLATENLVVRFHSLILIIILSFSVPDEHQVNIEAADRDLK